MRQKAISVAVTFVLLFVVALLVYLTASKEERIEFQRGEKRQDAEQQLTRHEKRFAAATAFPARMHEQRALHLALTLFIGTLSELPKSQTDLVSLFQASKYAFPAVEVSSNTLFTPYQAIAVFYSDRPFRLITVGVGYSQSSEVIMIRSPDTSAADMFGFLASDPARQTTVYISPQGAEFELRHLQLDAHALRDEGWSVLWLEERKR